jgi:hypothetical protein
MEAPILELVRFNEDATPTTPVVSPVSPVDHIPTVALPTPEDVALDVLVHGLCGFVTTSRGLTRFHASRCYTLQPSSFIDVLTVIPAMTLSIPPPKRQPRRNGDTLAPSRCSSRLVKKAGQRVPAVAATQNVLMRRLGLASMEHVDS